MITASSTRIDVSKVSLGENEFLLSPGDLPKVQKTLARLGKKAAKRGGTPATLDVVREVLCSFYRDRRLVENQFVKALVVKPTGELFKMKGHKLVCSLEHTPAGNIVRKAPRFEDIDTKAYRETDCYCEHCKTKRLRKDTFVLQDENGKLMQVGRNCLADFIRDEDVATILNFQEVMLYLSKDYGDPGEDFCGGGYWPSCWKLSYVVATAYKAIKAHGFSPAAHDRPTKDDVSWAINPPPLGGETRRAWDQAQPGPDDFKGAEAVIEFIKESDSDSDYFHNLRVAFSREVDSRSLGLVVSAVGVYFRELGKKAEKKVKKNEHFGEEKKRYSLKLTLVKAVVFESELFGDFDFMIFEDAEGRTFTWKTQSAPKIEAGDKITGKGTVKAHTEYKGKVQTELSRCKFTKVES